MTVNAVSNNTNLAPAVRKRLLQVCLVTIVQATVLFLAAGRLDWPMAWAYFGVYAGSLVMNIFVFLRGSPELIAERGQVKGNVKEWDKSLAALVSLVGPLATLLVAGLDVRFSWSAPLPAIAAGVGLVVLALSYLLFGWAMSANKFFSGVVRIQSDRGHTVATAGPYRYVRHPGYVAMIGMSLATPAILGGLWAYLPAGLTVGLIVLRTALEDRTLRLELPGYAEFARAVRYRLLPGIW